MPILAGHAPECEFASETEPAVLRHLLRLKEGLGGDYWWVECGSCQAGWQVLDFAEQTVGRRTGPAIPSLRTREGK